MAEQTAEPNTKTALARFTVQDAAIAKMREEYLPLTIKGIDDKEGADRVHKAKMHCVRSRTATEKVAKELNQEARDHIAKVNGEKTRIIGLLAPIEDHLKAEESRIEQEIAAERTRLWREEEEKKRQAEEAAEAERQKKIAEENEQLAQQRAELERQMAELNAARQKQEEEAAAARAAQEAEAARLAAERQAIEDSRRRIEEAAAAERQGIADAEARATVRPVETQPTLWPHQQAIVDELESHPGFIAGLPLDTGKTANQLPWSAPEEQARIVEAHSQIAIPQRATPAPDAVEPSPFLQEDAAKLHTVAACLRGIDVPSMATTEGQAAAARVNAILDKAAADVRDVALGLTPMPGTTPNVLPTADESEDAPF